uniref:Gamma-aminobutyric acid receptor subunit beta n=1 Tax=Onchocerca volvulus TaxID=6282 RepID=A0A8R1U1I6_ONCVO
MFSSPLGQLLNSNNPRIDVNNISLARTSVYYENASALLVDLLSDYDMRLRPGFGGDALLLTLDIIIASIDAISEVNMDYTITMYLNQYWRDERLSWSHHFHINEMTLSGDFSQRIWVPDTFLANDKQSFLHDVTEKNKMIRIEHNGQITYGMRFTTTLACHMDLRNYPLDNQNCTVEIESYGYTISEVLMRWNQPKAVFGIDKADVPQFQILDYQTLDRIVRTATGAYQRLSLAFHFKRSAGYFVFQTYLPCILIVMLSWVSFWINHEATSARVALGITTVLTMTTISTGVRQSLPRISYVKSIDVYLVACFMFVFAALLEYAAVNYSYYGGQSKPYEAANKWRNQNVMKCCTSKDNKDVNLRGYKIEKNRKNESAATNEVLYRTFVTNDNDKKRSPSPLLSLMPTNLTRDSIDLSIPDYPRLTTGNKFWHRKRLNQNGKFNMKLRNQNIKIHVQWLHSRARSVVESFHYMLLGILYNDAIMQNLDINELDINFQ